MLKEVSAQADAGGAEKPRVYHHRLREALDLLAEFFHAEGKGMTIIIILYIYSNETDYARQLNFYIDYSFSSEANASDSVNINNNTLNKYNV